MILRIYRITSAVLLGLLALMPFIFLAQYHLCHIRDNSHHSCIDSNRFSGATIAHACQHDRETRGIAGVTAGYEARALASGVEAVGARTRANPSAFVARELIQTLETLTRIPPAQTSRMRAREQSFKRHLHLPFVATLVDVTGLIIYFSIALVIMRGVMLSYSAVASAVVSG
jgi:hypothetical protein